MDLTPQPPLVTLSRVGLSNSALCRLFSLVEEREANVSNFDRKAPSESERGRGEGRVLNVRFRGEGPEDDDCTPRTAVSELSRGDMDKDAKSLGETSVVGALEVNGMGGVEIEKVGTVVVLHFDPEDVSRPNAGPNDCIVAVGVSQSNVLLETDVGGEDSRADTGLDIERRKSGRDIRQDDDDAASSLSNSRES